VMNNYVHLDCLDWFSVLNNYVHLDCLDWFSVLNNCVHLDCLDWFSVLNNCVHLDCLDWFSGLNNCVHLGSVNCTKYIHLDCHFNMYLHNCKIVFRQNSMSTIHIVLQIPVTHLINFSPESMF
jgi:hypothetical protein